MVQSKAWLRWGLLIIAAVALLIIGGCRAGNTTADVGVIDISKIVAKSSKAQAYQQQLVDKLEELETRLEEETADLDEEEAQQKQKEIYSEYLTLKQELEGKLENEINEALKKVVDKRNLDLVLYRESVRYGGVDITDSIIEELD
ncbi:MAG: OmpH family outer membrane protein [Firmicutes bacterium]|nr:OmpH family outer membrane protein [Bacillota bacterium]